MRPSLFCAFFSHANFLLKNFCADIIIGNKVDTRVDDARQRQNRIYGFSSERFCKKTRALKHAGVQLF